MGIEEADFMEQQGYTSRTVSVMSWDTIPQPTCYRRVGHAINAVENVWCGNFGRSQSCSIRWLRPRKVEWLMNMVLVLLFMTVSNCFPMADVKGNSSYPLSGESYSGPPKPRWFRVVNSKAAHPAMYVPGDGLVYCPIAKVACSEWRKAMRWMLGIPGWDSGPIHEQNGIPLVASRHRVEVERMMNDDSWHKFVVVREPAERLLSAFLNKCAGSEWFNCPYLEFLSEHFKGTKDRTPATDRNGARKQ
ncbi:unnamed protein product [Choristocarpus tenellus]